VTIADDPARRATPSDPPTSRSGPLTSWTAAGLAAAVRDRRLSAREVLDAHWQRMEALDPAINAVVVRCREGAAAAAAAVDADVAAGRPLGPLAGVPITIKEAFDVAGLPGTCGMVEQSGRVSTHDAVAVGLLRAAGAVIMGKTNVPVALADLQSDNPVYGRTVNPWDPTRTCGGSSGGSAAAIAAGFSSLDVGSDLSGSIRVPASFCGVFGLRPSNGVLSKLGHLPWPDGWVMEPEISVIGPMARDPLDLRLALDVLAGHPPGGGLPPLGPPAAHPWRAGAPGRTRRILVWRDAPGAPVDAETAEVLDATVAEVERAGWATEELTAPFDTGQALAVLWRLVFAEIVAGMTDEQWRAAAAGAADLRQHLADQERHRELGAALDTAMAGYDALLCPATATVAPEHDTRPPAERVVWVDDLAVTQAERASWSLLAALAQGPTVTFPAGLGRRSGMPVGLQLVGRRWGDRPLLDVAADLDDVLDHPLRRWEP
jgi:amidase